MIWYYCKIFFIIFFHKKKNIKFFHFLQFEFPPIRFPILLNNFPKISLISSCPASGNFFIIGICIQKKYLHPFFECCLPFGSYKNDLRSIFDKERKWRKWASKGWRQSRKFGPKSNALKLFDWQEITLYSQFNSIKFTLKYIFYFINPAFPLKCCLHFWYPLKMKCHQQMIKYYLAHIWADSTKCWLIYVFKCKEMGGMYPNIETN